MKTIGVLLGSAFCLLVAMPAGAITNGQVDGTAHPNVAAVVFLDKHGDAVGLCGGSLLSSTVLLTTAHCAGDVLNFTASGGDVGVSFDPQVDTGTSTFHAVSGATISPYFNPKSGLFDQGVLLLKDPVTGIAPVDLPAANQVVDIGKSGSYTVVGYGLTRDCPVGHCMLSFDGYRRAASERAAAVDRGGGVEFQMNPMATGVGGTCYGDGGDPVFLGSTNVQGAIQDGMAGFGASQSPCHSVGFGFRLDSKQARSFLSNYVTVP